MYPILFEAWVAMTIDTMYASIDSIQAVQLFNTAFYKSRICFIKVHFLTQFECVLDLIAILQAS